jgi:uncharacterized protein YjbI with pentapeptide repeats
VDRDEAIRLLKGGKERVEEWNRTRKGLIDMPSFVSADLVGADLRGAHLRDADLQHAALHDTKLHGADLRYANLRNTNLRSANLNKAVLRSANLYNADLGSANVFGADLRNVNLRSANLFNANLRNVNLSDANLFNANLYNADLSYASLSSTQFNSVDLSTVRGLDTISHEGPSSVDTHTLRLSKGRLPEVFLRGCGLSPWEVLTARLYDPTLTPRDVDDLVCEIHFAWSRGLSMINGCFISYSHDDAAFAETLRERLIAAGINAWLDTHDMRAGEMQDQVWKAIQIYHVVIIVLSEKSIRKDWVEHELGMARAKENAEGRAVLCPVALDDAWKTMLPSAAAPGGPKAYLWSTLTSKYVVDFSAWQSGFDEPFEKLLDGLKKNYRPPAAPPPVEPG